MLWRAFILKKKMWGTANFLKPPEMLWHCGSTDLIESAAMNAIRTMNQVLDLKTCLREINHVWFTLHNPRAMIDILDIEDDDG